MDRMSIQRERYYLNTSFQIKFEKTSGKFGTEINIAIIMTVMGLFPSSSILPLYKINFSITTVDYVR